VVQNQVTSLKPGATESVPARPGAPIVLDELEASGPASSAKMTFGDGAVISIGQRTEFKVTRQAVDEATGASTSTIDLAIGKLRVFVSRFWSGRPEVRVETPTAVVGIKGSEVVVEVLEDGTTKVTVLSGSASVARKGLPGIAKTVGPSAMIAVLAGRDDAPPDPSPEDDDVLAGLWNDTEPDPSQPPDQPSSTAREASRGHSGLAVDTQGLSSAGATMGRPQTHTVPESVIRDDNPTGGPDG
jgi:hypothetical protein